MLAVVFEVRRQIGTELVVVFEVAGVSARDLISSGSSTIQAIGHLIGVMARDLVSLYSSTILATGRLVGILARSLSLYSRSQAYRRGACR